MPLERNFQPKVIKELRLLLPDVTVLKGQSMYMQGIPDLLFLYKKKWGMLEVKRKYPVPGSDDFEPNQEYYIEMFDSMSFARCIYPENAKEVFDAIQQTFLPRRQARLSQP